MRRPSLQLTGHGRLRWVQRTGAAATQVSAAWHASIYTGWLHLPPRGGRRGLTVQGYRWRGWVLVVVYRPPYLTRGARRTWPVGYTLVTCWPVAWWDRKQAQQEQRWTMPPETPRGAG